MSSISKDVLKTIEAVSGDGNNRVRVEFRRFSLPSNWFVAALAIPMLTALAISSYLTYVSVTASEIAGCTGGQLFDCAHVIYSKWSKVFGIPVSAMALGTYVAMIVAASVTCMKKLSSPVRLMAWSAVTGLAIAAALAALYFIYLQVFVLEHLCPWCLGAHACGLLIATAVLVSRTRIALPPLAAVSSLAAAGLAVMIGVQVNSEEVQMYETIDYVPTANAASGDDSTFAVAPEDFENAPVDDGMMLLPPGDDDLFMPPMDEEFEDEEDDSIETPSEDTSESDDDVAAVQVSQLRSLAKSGVDAACQLAAVRSPLASLMILQQSSQQEKEEASEADADADSEQDDADDQADSEDQNDAEAKKKPKQEKPEPRIVEFMGRKLNAHQWPVDGSPTAKYVFVEMFDYTCSHCRSTSEAIFKVKERMGDDLAVVVLPVPMNSRCNGAIKVDHLAHAEACEISTLAIAVWRCDPAKFSEFHKWLLDGKDAPSFAEALAKANEMVGEERLDKERKKKTAGAYVQRHCMMYKMLNGGAVPKLLFPKQAVQGAFTGVDALENLIKEQAGR
ncbi:vitamin K epoxide reductase family protein [Mariniblastus fucicola]|uniref:Vitamin K epoxide reductase family protein n=1 Tax=Mariniblastus fucicola TaxID=980251 RepID=A0A5B9P7V6_9BACT|nr:vitamin K epoxide reductase family protein [Mariniblastus fucicola]QEG21285.1 Vitamin K epoxide reductase family protein [Mariniblastus fucicola]